MIIFLILISILLIILFLKIKLKIFFTLNKFDYYYSIDILLYNLKIKKIDKKDTQKYINKSKTKNKKYNNKKLIGILKKIKIEELFIDIKVGLIEILPTVFAIPIISTIISTLCAVLNLEKSKIKYSIKPIYNNLAIQSKIVTTITFRPIEILMHILSDTKIS